MRGLDRMCCCGAGAIGEFKVRAIPDTGHFGHLKRPYGTLRVILREN